MRGAVVRGWATRDGDLLLATEPREWPAAWLSEVLRQLAGHEVSVSVIDCGVPLGHGQEARRLRLRAAPPRPALGRGDD